MKKCAVFMAGLILILFSSGCSKATQDEHHEGHHEHGGLGAAEERASGHVEDGVRVVEIRASRYEFEPDPIVVNYGEKVRLVAAGADVTHGIAIPDFNVNLTIPPGEANTAEFVADKKGTFHAHCSVYCGPGHGHMRGSLIVK